MKIEAFTKKQLIYLLLLRFVVGWHVLYEGIVKVLNPEWSSSNFLRNSEGILAGLNQWILSNHAILETVDLLNKWGLVAIGLGLIFGFFFKIAALTGSILLFTYYLSAPPLVGLEYAWQPDSNDLVINAVLIESILLFGFFLFSTTSKVFGLDFFIQSTIKQKKDNGRLQK